MADQLYLSLWFPDFRLEALPEKLVSVLQQFARVSGNDRVTASAAIPFGWSEAPAYQRLFVNDDRAEPTDDSLAINAIREATEILHDDMAYEFEMRWKLWSPVQADPQPPNPRIDIYPEFESVRLDTLWKPQPATVKIIGFGPQFDDASFEQNGHIRIDFGLDTPWVLEDEELNQAASQRIQQHVEKLLAFTLSVEKNCGISSRLLWTESGEPLAQKLIDRLQRVN